MSLRTTHNRSMLEFNISTKSCLASKKNLQQDHGCGRVVLQEGFKAVFYSLSIC